MLTLSTDRTRITAGRSPLDIMIPNTKHKRSRAHKRGPPAKPPGYWPIRRSAGVLPFDIWCRLNNLSPRTGRRILASGNGPRVTQLSSNRIGITYADNRAWQESRARGVLRISVSRQSVETTAATTKNDPPVRGGSRRKQSTETAHKVVCVTSSSPSTTTPKFIFTPELRLDVLPSETGRRPITLPRLRFPDDGGVA